MWQFLLVAAVAGFFSNRLRAAKGCRSSAGGATGEGIEEWDEQLVSASDRTQVEALVDSVEFQVSSPTALLSQKFGIDGCVPKEEGVFRFSSPESGIGNGSRLGARDLGKKVQRKGSWRFRVRLKRRRIGMNLAANKHGSCPFKGGCAFGWGLGVGMICMMSSEISKLNSAMDEAAKSIKELKAELHKRRSSTSMLIGFSADEVKINTTKYDSEPNKEHNGTKLSSFIDDGDSPSSVLTQEQDQDLIEIDQLEAEFVLELQKLPWCTEEASQPDGMSHNLPTFDLVNDAENETKHHYSDPYHFHGVNPSELEQKLSLLLIEQQENQIMELESELGRARLKLNGKEAELQALKDRLRRLTELSVTDDETEAHDGSVRCTDNWDYNNMMRSESKQSVVVMKRSNLDSDSELCGY